MDQSPDIIHILSADRITGISLFHHMFHNIFEQIIQRKRCHMASMRHDRTHFLILESKNILDHFSFILVKDTFLMCLIHHGNDFFLGHCILLLPMKNMCQFIKYP